MLGDELPERRRLASADLLDHVVRAGKDTVLVIDGDFTQTPAGRLGPAPAASRKRMPSGAQRVW